jgi:peptidoglycan/xylan/chitin deacetylase (PgdA/CDA1 family)
MRRFSELWYYIKNLKYLFQGNCVVLIYHRVTDVQNDPQMLAVSPAHFEDQLVYLKQNYKILSLDELILCLHKKKIPSKSIVITFDDGYADNLYLASPILSKHNLPATIFITSGMIESKREFWWDSLENIFLADIFANDRELQMEVAGSTYRWNIKNTSDAETVYDAVHTLLKTLPRIYRDEKILELYQWAGKEISQRATNATLLKAELKELAGIDFIEIGAHTINHPRLSNEDFKVQASEIANSKIQIEECIGKKVFSFSYPYGNMDDFNKNSVELVKKAGYRCGISNIQGKVDRDTNIFEIPRRLVRDWNAFELEQQLQTFFAKPINLLDIIKAKLKLRQR